MGIRYLNTGPAVLDLAAEENIQSGPGTETYAKLGAKLPDEDKYIRDICSDQIISA